MRSLTVKVAVSVPVMVRPQVADIKVRMHVPAAEFAPVLKADKCRFTDVFLREDSIIHVSLRSTLK